MKLTVEIPVRRDVARHAFPSPHLMAIAMLEEAKADREAFWVVHLDSANEIIGLELLTIGSLKSALIHPTELFRKALSNTATGILTVHVQPSCHFTPSIDDRDLWITLSQAGELVGIKLIDHLVATSQGSFYSQRATA